MRRKLLYFLAFAGLIAAAALVIGRDFDRRLFLESLSSIRPAWLLASVLVGFLGYALRAVRWQQLLISFKNIDLPSLFSTTVLGFAAIYVLGRAGEVVRPVWLARQKSIPITAAAASLVVERVFDMIMILALLLAGLAWTDPPAAAAGVMPLLARAGWVLMVVSTSMLVMLVVSHRYDDWVIRVVPGRWLRSQVVNLISGIGPVSSPRALATITGHSILVWIAVALQFWLMLVGLDLTFTIPEMFLVMTVTAMGSLAQIPGIGGGLQAAFAFTTTTFLEVPAEVGLASALMAWLLMYIPTMAAAGLYIVTKGISARDLIGISPGTKTD